MIGTPRMFSPTVNVLVSFVDEIVARHGVPRVYDSNGYGVGIAALGSPTVFRQLDQWLRLCAGRSFSDIGDADDSEEPKSRVGCVKCAMGFIHREGAIRSSMSLGLEGIVNVEVRDGSGVVTSFSLDYPIDA